MNHPKFFDTYSKSLNINSLVKSQKVSVKWQENDREIRVSLVCYLRQSRRTLHSILRHHLYFLLLSKNAKRALTFSTSQLFFNLYLYSVAYSIIILLISVDSTDSILQKRSGPRNTYLKWRNHERVHPSLIRLRSHLPYLLHWLLLFVPLLRVSTCLIQVSMCDV